MAGENNNEIDASSDIEASSHDVSPAASEQGSKPVLKAISPSAIVSTMSLFMFVGGGFVTLMMLARAFDLHGQVLVGFVIGSSALILGLAGGLLLKIMDDKWWIGAIIGACFGVISATLVYFQTRHYQWWQ